MAERIVILLIEDNPGDRRLIMQEFQTLGQHFTFIVKEDGEDALLYLEEMKNKDKAAEIPHLIILDLNLPRANGIEVLKECKKHPMLLTVPVVVFSSSNAAADIQAAYDNYANCYIPKPFYYEDFSRSIRSIWEFWFNITKLPKH